MTNQYILNCLKKILGSMYDPNKEEMYLRVARRVEESNLLIQSYSPILSTPLSQREFDNSMFKF